VPMKFSLNPILKLAVCMFVPVVSFASDSPYLLNAKGNFTDINVPAGSTASTVSAYVVTRGNESEYVNATVTGPLGTKVTVRSQTIGKGGVKTALASTKNWIAAKFQQGSESVPALKITGIAPNSSSGSSGGSTTGSRFYCLDFTAEDLDEIIGIFRQLGNNYTRDELCALYGDNTIRNNVNTGTNGTVTPVPTGTVTSVSGAAHIRKDTCSLTKNAQTVVRFDIALNEISESDRANGFTIKFSALPLKFVGNKAASIKPTSDGKFAPRALFLVHTTGFGGGVSSPERMNLIRFSRGKVGVTNLKIEDYVPYRGKMLARAVAEKYLRGGKGVVEMQNDFSTYSVCFKLIKARQRVNGYTNG